MNAQTPTWNLWTYHTADQHAAIILTCLSYQDARKAMQTAADAAAAADKGLTVRNSELTRIEVAKPLGSHAYYGIAYYIERNA